jgi:hypothetical protein
MSQSTSHPLELSSTAVPDKSSNAAHRVSNRQKNARRKAKESLRSYCEFYYIFLASWRLGVRFPLFAGADPFSVAAGFSPDSSFFLRSLGFFAAITSV